MTLENKISILDQTPLMGYYNLEKLTMEVRTDYVIYVKIKPLVQIQIRDILQVEEIMENEYPGKKFFNLFDFDQSSDLDEDVRKWAADSNGNTRTLADAIVNYSLPQRIITNFYLKVNQPPKPTKVFSSAQEGLVWLKSLYN